LPRGFGLRLSREQTARLGAFGTTNPEAHKSFLRGRLLLQSENEEDDLEAQKLFAKAIEGDPNFVNAHLALASTYVRSIANGYVPLRQALGHAEAALAKAAVIEPNNVSVRVAKAHLSLMTTHDWTATEHEYRAVMNEPALLHTTAYHPISLFFVATERPDEAVALLKRALEVDPDNLETRLMLGNFLEARHPKEALQVYDRIIAEVSEDWRAWFGRADVYKGLSDFPGAAEARLKALGLAATTTRCGPSRA
jgi:tetratricopeptide (TPR) repeat protein